MLRCRCETHQGELLAVTGASSDLGAWRKGSVLPMVQDSEDRSLWQLSVSLSSSVVHQYRYCVIVVLQVSILHSRTFQPQSTVNTVILQPIFPGNPKRIIVRRWETHFMPR